jgi:hypothetical protein
VVSRTSEATEEQVKAQIEDFAQSYDHNKC